MLKGKFMNSNYYVALKENLTFNREQADKIREMELPTPEERFPMGSKPIEVYFKGEERECEAFIQNLPKIIKDLFTPIKDGR